MLQSKFPSGDFNSNNYINVIKISFRNTFFQIVRTEVLFSPQRPLFGQQKCSLIYLPSPPSTCWKDYTLNTNFDALIIIYS